MLPQLYHRHGLGQFLTGLGLFGEGVEVGCAFGGFSERILEQWPGRALHLVDPWVKQDPNVYREITNEITNWESWYQEARQRLARFPAARFHRMFSHEAAPLFAEGSLDFVYLDGNHAYEPVIQDLNLWFPKVRSGGVFSGHDYYDTKLDGKWCEVKTAVDRFCIENRLEFHVCPGGCTSWYLIK